MRKEKKRRGKGEKKSIKKLVKRSVGFLMCCCLSVARFIRVIYVTVNKTQGYA